MSSWGLDSGEECLVDLDRDRIRAGGESRDGLRSDASPACSGGVKMSVRSDVQAVGGNDQKLLPAEGFCHL